MEYIKVENLTKYYGNYKALNNVNFSINSGEVFGYIGPNGAGKTTTIRILCEICNPSSGRVIINKGQEKPANIGVVLDINGLYNNLTAYENLLYFARLCNIDKKYENNRIEELLSIVGLSKYSNNLVKTFSKGMSRRLAIARSIINNPQILILDEPFDGVDVESHFLLKNFIRKWVVDNNSCIFFTSHNMKDVEEICNKVAIIKSGEIIDIQSTHNLRNSNDENIICIILSHDSDLSNAKKVLNEYGKILKSNDELNEIFLKLSYKYNSSQVINTLINNGVNLLEIKRISSNLEEVYVKKVNDNA